MIKIAPSILSCDFSKIGEEVQRIDKCGADYIHIDVMDGHFVPNITFGAPVVKCFRKCTDKVFDCHLMISNPLKYAEDFAKAGADIINFHVECDSPIQETIDKIHALGCKAALTVKPKTPIEEVYPYLKDISMVLIMTVEPGFGGQKFMTGMLEKVSKLRAKATKEGLDLEIQVDGGISIETAPAAISAGANVLVAGSAVFGADDTAGMISALRGGEV